MVELKDRLTTLDKNKYIEIFIKEFIKYFPNIYTYQELQTILQNVVYGVFLCDGNIDYNVVGGYYNDYKSIILTSEEFNSITFHEFIHAIRNFYYSKFPSDIIYTSKGFEKHNIDDGIEEAFTELVTCLYEKRKKLNNNNNNYMQVYYQRKDIEIYEIIAILANELEYIVNKLDSKRDLVNIFLKGGNIPKEIYFLTKSFINKINSFNEYSKEELNQIAYQLTYYYIEYLLYISNGDIDLIELTYILEKLNRYIAFVLNNNKPTDLVDYSVYKRLFNEKSLYQKNIINKYDINDLNNDISRMVIFLDNYPTRKLTK